MIEIKSKMGKGLTCSAAGTAPELLAELMAAMNCLYTQIKEANEKEAEYVKAFLTKNIDLAFMDTDEAGKEMKRRMFKMEIEDIIRSEWE